MQPLSAGTLEFGFVDNEKVSPFGETNSWRGVVDEVGGGLRLKWCTKYRMFPWGIKMYNQP